MAAHTSAMKNLFLLLIAFCSYRYASAGCGINLNIPSQASGNFTYDSITNTYYIQPGDTLHYNNGVNYSGTDSHNWCTLNDSVFAQSTYVHITLPGVYKFYGNCEAGNSTYGMLLGSVNVEYITPSSIEEPGTKETCAAFFNHATQNLVINYSNMHRQRITYSLYNLSGQQILHGGFTPSTGAQQQYNIDLSGNLSGAGMYIMVMETLTDRYTCKLVY